MSFGYNVIFISFLMVQSYAKTREKPNLFELFRVHSKFGEAKVTKKIVKCKRKVTKKSPFLLSEVLLYQINNIGTREGIVEGNFSA